MSLIGKNEEEILNELKNENSYLRSQLEKQTINNKLLEESFSKHTKLLLELNNFSLELAYIPNKEVFPYIVTKLKDIFGVKGAWITTYDEISSNLIVEYSSLSNDENSVVVKLIGRELIKFRIHINDAQYQRITTEIVGQMSSVNELTFGAIPDLVGKIIENIFNIGWFVCLALLFQGKLVGTIIILGDKNQIPPNKDEIIAFGGITSNALGRKKAEESLLEKEQNYLDIFNSSNDALFIHELKTGAILDVNTTMLKMYGYDNKQEVLSNSIEYLSAVERGYEKTKIIEKLQETINIGTNIFEWLAKKKNGETFWVEVSLHAVKIGGDDRIMANVHDISLRKLAEETLLHEQMFTKKMLDSLPGIFYLYTYPELKLVLWNKNHATLLGYESDEIANRSIMDWHVPEAKNAVKEAIDIVMQKGQNILESPLLHKDGHYVPFLMTGMRFETKEQLYLMGFGIDITDRKKTEEALTENQQENNMLAAALRNINECVTITDENNNLLFVNDTFLKVYGYSRAEVIGKNIEIVKPNNSEIYDRNKILTSTLNGGWQGELINKKKDGTEFPIFLSTTLIEEPNNNKKLLLGSAIDITQRKESEELLQQKNKELESQYEEYMQLNEVLRQTNYDLEIAKLKAEENDRLKTAFLQNISHEIRTPLNGIIGFTNLLTTEKISKDDIEECKTLIQQSGDRLIEIVNNVIDISKIETGQTEIFNKYFSINSLITDLYSLFNPLAIVKKLNLQYFNALDDENSIIFSDEFKVNQILTNLLNNALKFTLNGSVEFGYEIDFNIIKFFVKDTGIGITSELHDRIFERFAQAEDTIGRTFEGAGLGLAICKGLVEMLGGHIWLNSEINKGSTFYFTIPFTFKSHIQQMTQTDSSTKDRMHKTTILIAEDDFTSFKYICRALKNNDFTIIQANNGEEAVANVINNPDIDLILMDIRMPVMNGFEATRQIKKIRPDLPIIAQTAYAFSEEKEKILSAGCDDYLSKPIEINRLKKLVEKYLK